MPARPPKPKPQPQVSTAALQNQAGNLVQKAKEPEDDDLLVLSDDDSDGMVKDPIAIADDGTALVRLPSSSNMRTSFLTLLGHKALCFCPTAKDDVMGA